MKNLKGIILQNTKFKERDLICKVLLSNGKILSCMFYGGQGGGTKKKTSILDIGNVIQFNLQRQNKAIISQVVGVKEWTLTWAPSEIRLNHQAFYILCLYLETITKLGVEVGNDIGGEQGNNLDDISEEFAGFFNVLSNGIFYLDDCLKNKQFYPNQQIGFFIPKLLHHLGVYPNAEQCLYCNESLEKFPLVSLIMSEGGFSCAHCLTREEKFDKADIRNFADGKKALSVLRFVKVHQYKEYALLENKDKNVTELFFQYLCYQFQLKLENFKSYSLVINSL